MVYIRNGHLILFNEFHFALWVWATCVVGLYRIFLMAVIAQKSPTISWRKKKGIELFYFFVWDRCGASPWDPLAPSASKHTNRVLYSTQSFHVIPPFLAPTSQRCLSRKATTKQAWRVIPSVPASPSYDIHIIYFALVANLQQSRRDLEKTRFLYTKDHNTAAAAAQKCIFIKAFKQELVLLPDSGGGRKSSPRIWAIHCRVSFSKMDRWWLMASVQFQRMTTDLQWSVHFITFTSHQNW